jgi:hypothetical protein
MTPFVLRTAPASPGGVIPTEARPRQSHDMATPTTVQLRSEHNGADHRYLIAHLEPNGDLRLSGQDIGPGTSAVSSDGEYEWENVVPAAHIPALLEALGAPADADILAELAARWTGPASYELERCLRESDIPVRLWVH